MEPIRLAAGESLGRYEILEHLASGGMAEVYLGRRTGIGGFTRQVVLKTIRASFAEDDAYVRMFLDEARIAGSVNHPNVAAVYEADEVDGIAFLVMEYVPGPSLSRLVHFAEQLDRRDRVAVAHLIAGAARGLHHVHRAPDADGACAGLVHRDISLDNILASRDGTAKVIDFGIALARGRLTQTEADVVKGKLGYVSPEQIAGRPVDHRADLYALGVCLYRATIGAPPFANADLAELLRTRLTNDFKRPTEVDPDFPPALEAIILKAMAMEPEDRYESGGQLATELEVWLRSERPDFDPADVAEWIGSCFRTEADWRRRMPQPRSQPPSSTSLAGPSPVVPAELTGATAWVPIALVAVAVVLAVLVLALGLSAGRGVYTRTVDAVSVAAPLPVIAPVEAVPPVEAVSPVAAPPEPPSKTPVPPAPIRVAPPTTRAAAPVASPPPVAAPPPEAAPPEAHPRGRRGSGDAKARPSKP